MGKNAPGKRGEIRLVNQIASPPGAQHNAPDPAAPSPMTAPRCCLPGAGDGPCGTTRGRSPRACLRPVRWQPLPYRSVPVTPPGARIAQDGLFLADFGAAKHAADGAIKQSDTVV